MWLDFNPVRGHEQDGRRPALVISPEKYNVAAGLALVCPVTSKTKGYPFEVEFKIKAAQGIILADQIRAIDWTKRRAEKLGTVSEAVITTVQDCVRKLILD